jgi:predicted transcriptional regulator
MFIRDCIKRDFITIKQTASFRDAIATMIQNKTNGLIVVDDTGHEIGVLDSFHLINTMIPSYLKDDPTLAKFEDESVFAKAVESVLTVSVASMMQPLHGICVHEDDQFMLAATLSSKHGTRYIPVHDDQENLVGIITRTQIKRGMAKILGIEDDL